MIGRPIGGERSGSAASFFRAYHDLVARLRSNMRPWLFVVLSGLTVVAAVSMSGCESDSAYDSHAQSGRDHESGSSHDDAAPSTSGADEVAGAPPDMVGTDEVAGRPAETPQAGMGANSASMNTDMNTDMAMNTGEGTFDGAAQGGADGSAMTGADGHGSMAMGGDGAASSAGATGAMDGASGAGSAAGSGGDGGPMGGTGSMENPTGGANLGTGAGGVSGGGEAGATAAGGAAAGVGGGSGASGDRAADGGMGGTGGGGGSGGVASGVGGAGAGGAGAEVFAGASGAAAGSGGGAGTNAGASGASGAGGSSASPCVGPPGLYAGTACSALADGVEPFVPQYPLVSDDGQGNAAVKARWVYLPPGGMIDTSNPDRWSFPVGTVLFKEFADPKTGKKIETRRLEKTAASAGYTSWTAQSYAWSSDQRSVSVASSSGVPNALGSGFDIPSSSQCRQCHLLVGTTNVDAAIGFNAIQLNHSLGGLDLATLLVRGQLKNVSDPEHPNVSLSTAVVPGTAVQRAGLGYLHGNCSHCHGGPSPHGHQSLWTPVGTASVTDLPMFGAGMTGVVCHCLDLWRGHSNGSDVFRLRIDPGSGDTSGIIGRLLAPGGTRDAMPPVGRKGADAAGIATVIAFIDSLDGTACAANPPRCSQ